jgi:hypothetical protein
MSIKISVLGVEYWWFFLQIAKYLEERCYKELRSEHIKFINIVMEAYNKLLCICKGQM